ncbi:MarR family transcriptional regulator [Clostridium sp. cel8]|jgi:MarR family transcriptional regulator, organic hydroperoxide resistance regulator|uniref:MarR family winged helix-turn-helix transcriptional regulator n=1 Tax=Clostridium sp. cel8 TaxID=2663123 RepID=UPI0015F6FD36|nr:MarR family transcriptional regulator [Clostridium sp. cel8]MBA5850070.1 MarR family transcriptional regulator [Clostridium sp. cel8]
MDDVKEGIRLIKILKRFMNGIHKNMEKSFKDLNLTVPQMMVVMTLISHGKMKISDLSKKISLSNSTVSGIVDRLEKQNTVERIRGKKDRRVVYVNVTPEFRKIIKEKHEQVDTIVKSIVDSATPEELDTVTKGLDTLEKIMDRKKLSGE